MIESSQVTFTPISFEQAESFAHEHSLPLPIEQSRIWAEYQETFDGRTPWKVLQININGLPSAIISLIKYTTHGYSYLRSTHGPLWMQQPDSDTEKAVLAALVKTVRKVDSSIVFLRIPLWDIALGEPTLSSVPYDTTVIVNLEGGEEAILSRMKTRGRRDVRKSLRESPVECSDETAQAIESFDEYYDVMRETGERDGFTPALSRDYHNMLTTLGPAHCRLFAGRIDGKVTNWAIVTINDGQAVYYYGCTGNEARKLYVADKLVFYFMNVLSQEGITSLDMMGIGSDFSPTLTSLNKFKTKFSKETVPTAADRDIPVRRRFYSALQLAKKMKSKIRK